MGEKPTGQTRAGWAIEQYLQRSAKWERTRFTPERDVEVQRDPERPGVVFYRYPDGSSIRLDTHNSKKGGSDIQEF